MTDNPRMVKIAELWQRTSAKGTTYFSGFLGPCQLLMFDAGEQPHPTRPDETVHVWRLLVQERDPARRPPPPRPAERRVVERQHRALDRAGDAAAERDDVPFDDPVPFG